MRAIPSRITTLLALLILSAAARSEPISIVVTAHIVSAGLHPSVDNVLYEVTNGVAAAIPWDKVPVQTGDEMRVLLTFDSTTSSPLATYNNCEIGGAFRSFGNVTGSVTIAGISAVLTQDSNSVAAGACIPSGFPNLFVSIRSDVDGPSLTSMATLEDVQVTAEMPIRRFELGLFNLPGLLCVDPAGYILPQTSEEFVSNCAPVWGSGSGMFLLWQSGTFCGISCWYHSDFSITVNDLTISLPTNSDFVDQLVAEVLVLNLDQGIENSLDAKIADAVGASDNIALAQFAATAALKTSAKSAAKNKLGSFINEVNAQRGKAIPDIKATRLVTLANNLAARL